MAVTKEWLDRVMGSPDSVTAKLVALRRTPGSGKLHTGVWYSNFTRVKTEAERRGIPFFAMWTNGDVCSLCRRFTENVLSRGFTEYMRSSGGLWWLGGSMDDNDEDRRGGIGFNWCLAPDKHVTYFPFMAVSTVGDDGRRVETFGSGGDYDGGRHEPTGTSLAVDRLKKLVQVHEESNPAVPKAPKTNKARKAHKAPKAPEASGGDGVKETKDATGVDTPDFFLHIRFNPDWDAAHIARFQSALRANGGHCVCQANKSPDTMCMCRMFLEQSRPGRCLCGAFEKYFADDQ